MGLGSALIPRLLCGGLQRSNRFFLVVGPRAARACQPLGRLSPHWTCGLTFICRLESRLNPCWGSSGTGTYQYFSSFGEGGRCHSTCYYPHFFTIACLIFLFSTIPTLLGQRFFSNHGRAVWSMLFLPMRCFMRFC